MTSPASQTLGFGVIVAAEAFAAAKGFVRSAAGFLRFAGFMAPCGANGS